MYLSRVSQLSVPHPSLAKLQMEFIQARMQALTEQAKDLSETATKAVMESAKIPTKGGLSS